MRFGAEMAIVPHEPARTKDLSFLEDKYDWVNAGLPFLLKNIQER